MKRAARWGWMVCGALLLAAGVLLTQTAARAAEDGELLWAIRMGGPGYDTAGAIAVDAADNVLATASFGLAKYAPDGTLLWMMREPGGSGVAVDAAGNALVTGGFQGSVTFGSGGIHETTLTATGIVDVFIAKYAADGNLLWAKRAGGSLFDVGSGVAVDAAGNALVTGSFQGSVTFGPGEIHETTLSVGENNAFVAKYAPDGSLLWAKRAGGIPVGVAVDAAGNALVAGWFEGSATFGPGEAKETTLIPARSDAFIAKYAPDGCLLWAKREGGTSFDGGSGVAVDAAGNALVTGYFSQSATFGPGEPNETTLSGGENNVFIAKYAPDGTLLWAKRAGGWYARGSDVAVDAAGNALVTGWFYDSVTFGPGEANETTLTGGTFIAKYAPHGNLLWARRARGTQYIEGNGVAVDAAGNALVTGYFDGSATFGPGEPNETTLIGWWFDGFIAKYVGAQGYYRIINSGFETGKTPWVFWTDGAGTFANNAAGPASPKAAHVTITAPGTNVQLYQHGLGLEANTKYRLSFKAYSNTGHDLSVSILKHASPYTNYGLSGKVFNLTNAWAEYSVEFTTKNFTGTVNDARLMFWLAPYDAAGDQYYFDDVVLEKVMPSTPWAKTYGGENWDHAFSVKQTADRGYIVAGYTESFGAGSDDAWILKLNADGSVAWEKAYGGDSIDGAKSVQQTADGGYIVSGWTNSSGAGSQDAWILKLHSDGSIAWQKTYGGNGFEDVYSFIQQTADGGYIIAGRTDSFGAGSDDIWILKLKADGSVDWQKTYGGDLSDVPTSIQQTADGGYIVLAWTGSSGSWDFWILKLDADGSVDWQKTYGGGDEEMPASIQQTADGGYIVAGWTVSFGAGGRDFWVLKLDADGSVAWQKTYGDYGWDQACSVQQTADGGYIVAGWTSSFGAGSLDFWILKIQADGSVAWQKTYGGGEDDYYPSGVQQTVDGGYIVAGGTSSFGAGSWDFWILKLDSNGNCGDCPAAGVSDAVVGSTAANVVDTNASAIDAPGVTFDTLVTPTNTLAEVQQICPAVSNLITNPGFETGTTPWVFWTDGAGTFANNAAGPASPKAAHVTITAPGTNVQLYQNGLALEANTKYRLSFQAYSNTGHDVSLSLQKHGSPYTNYGLSWPVFNLTNSWQNIVVEFTTKNFTGTVNDGRLMFWLAPYDAAGDQYYFDDVVLERVVP